MDRDFSEAFGRADYPLDGVHLVAASAGTGKTWNIGNLYARLLMVHGLRVSQLLVVTFTEAATAELRERLRTLLGGLQEVLHGKDAPGSQAAALVGLLPPGEEARRRAQDAVDRALPEFDQAAISTIHAFCGRALRRYAFESGLAFDAEPPGSVRAAQLEAAARDWWRRNVALVPGSDPGFTLDGLLELLGENGPLGRPDIHPDPALDADAAEGEGKADDPTAADAENTARRLRVAFGLLERWHAERAERKEPDFDDILLGMREALRGPGRKAFAAALRAEFAAVLVDEFQDTDPVQYAIFREVFLEGAGNMPVYFIGDPKQAIYAFRGGDIHAYRAAAEAVPKERRWSLGENFRSAPGLVAAVNGLFRDAGGSWTFGDAAIPYPGDIRAAGGKRDIGDGGAAVQFATCGKDDYQVAEAVACEIAALLRARTILREEGKPERPLAPGDIAVLVRAGISTRGPEIARQLQARGVRAIVLDRKATVLRSAEAEAFRLLLAAFAQPGYAACVRGALLTPFFGLDAAAVAELAEPEGELAAGVYPAYPFLARRDRPEAPVAMTDFLRVFREWTDAWHDRGFLSAFARMEADLAFRPRIAAGPHGERALANVLHLAELVHAHVSATGALPGAALDWYVRKAVGASGDEACLRLESDADAVQILTLHSSKGLEYPVTVLPDSWRRPGGGRGKTPWHVFHRREEGGGYSLCVGVSPEAAAAEAREVEEEEMRLLYVGVTRAAWRCIVVAPEKESDITAPAFRFLLGRALSPELAGVVQCRLARTQEEVDATGPAPDSGEDETWLPEPPMPVLPPPRGRGSYSSLSPGAGTGDGRVEVAPEARDLDAGNGGAPSGTSTGEVADEAPSGHPIFAFPGGTVLGSCWHGIFEEADFRAGDAELRPLVAKKLLGSGLLHGTAAAKAERTETVLAMVRATLELEIDDGFGGSFRLHDIPWEDRASEWEFDFSSRDAADTTEKLREILQRHWGGEPDGSDHHAFLRTLERWDRPIHKGFLTGYIDLLFRHGGRYYVVDWKSNALGRRESAFSAAGLRDEMAAHAYFLQYLVYSAVLHRHLEACVPGYSWASHFGGVRYVFLRGAAIGRTAVYSDRPDESLLNDFADALGLRGPGMKGLQR